jgi:hypothetical protein
LQMGPPSTCRETTQCQGPGRGTESAVARVKVRFN